MTSILCWNVKELGLPSKCRALKDLLNTHRIDLVVIQETKKESFTRRQLNALSNNINFWLFKPSIGSLGGILFGINDNKFFIIDSWIMEFSISVLLSNKSKYFI